MYVYIRIYNSYNSTIKGQTAQLKMVREGWAWWHMPRILAAWVVELKVQGEPRQKVRPTSETISQA
jgi:hypothetical protein